MPISEGFWTAPSDIRRCLRMASDSLQFAVQYCDLGAAGAGFRLCSMPNFRHPLPDLHKRALLGMLAGRSRRGTLAASQISSIHFHTPICDIRVLSTSFRPSMSIPIGTFMKSFSAVIACLGNFSRATAHETVARQPSRFGHEPSRDVDPR